MVFVDSPEQTAMIKRLMEDIALIQSKLKRRENDYNAMAMEINNRNQKIAFVDKVLMLGAKGIGKSTFLWLRKELGLLEGPVPKPVFSVKDGTLTTEIDYGFVVDSVGISIEVDKLMRLIALLVVKDSVPRSLLLFSQRPVPDIIILGHLMVANVNACQLMGSMSHQLGTAVYDVLMENEMRRSGYNVVRHDDPELPTDCGLREAIITLFPTGTISAPHWEDLSKADALPLDTARATICRYIHFLIHNTISDVDFINAPRILSE